VKKREEVSSNSEKKEAKHQPGEEEQG